MDNGPPEVGGTSAKCYVIFCGLQKETFRGLNSSADPFPSDVHHKSLTQVLHNTLIFNLVSIFYCTHGLSTFCTTTSAWNNRMPSSEENAYINLATQFLMILEFSGLSPRLLLLSSSFSPLSSARLVDDNGVP